MEIKIHEIENVTIAEVISDRIVITTIQEGLDLLGNLYYQGFDKIVIAQKNVIPEFFDLKTGIAGEILQKFSNYRVRLAMVGDFKQYESKSLNDFIFESNKGKHVNFVNSISEALEQLSK